MKAFVAATVLSAALLVGAVEVHAIAWGGGSSSARASVGGSNGQNASVPEPSTLYAVGSAIALLGGAGWYIRRRK